MGPLDGVRVLDLTNVLAGPFCTHQLAHMGAEIVKVEVPGTGDLARQLGGDHDLNADGMGVSFLAQNSGKRSITLNLKRPEGRDLFLKLVRTADVVVENFRPGVMDRLGVSAEVLHAENPELVYCAISGFGQDGPLAKNPAYDQVVQGLSGVMSVTGAPDGPPMRVGYPVADTLGGLTAAFAIAAALARPKPGRGTVIDVSMLDSMLSAMGWVVSNHLIAGWAPHRAGNDNIAASPSGVFQARDGALNIAANKQEQFEALANVIERPDLVDDPRFADRKSRIENRKALTEAIEAALASVDAGDWVDRLSASGVPAGRIMTLPDILAHPQVADRGLVDAVPTPGVAREVRIVRPGFRMDGERPKTHLPPPELGAQTETILDELGVSTGDRAHLKSKGVI
ncbi:MAG: CaiB/BaiF CoA-transferase family protein [Paracoccaceae bacterium]|nr:CaiB/BaiF CoA-transferase family protein [Paracoccaceae bacterium]